MSAKRDTQVTIAQSATVRPLSCKARYTDAQSVIHELQLREAHLWLVIII